MPVKAAKTQTAAKHDPATLEWMLPLIIGVGAFVTLAKLLAGPLVLPLLSLLFISAGFVLAAALLLIGSRIGQSRNTAWMFAAALVAIGFAAALLSDGPEVLAELERMHIRGVASAGN